MSESWVRRIKQERRELNKTALLLKRRRISLLAAFADPIRELIQQKPDLTLRELKAKLQTDLSVQTLCTALQREQRQLNPDRLVCIDETWAKTNMTRP